MGEAFITRRGGGGGNGGLNFRVIGGTSTPSNPKENDIWINTNEPIPGWAFSVGNPYDVNVPSAKSITGLYFTADGGQGTNDSISITEYTKIPAGAKKITITNNKTTSVTCYHVFYDSAKGFVSSVKRTDGATGYDVPNNAVYIRLSVVTGDPFSFRATAAAEDGYVWISTGTSSPIEFNALKKNVIQVYPISAKQYVNGAWVEKTAKSRRGGAWVDWWNGELYDAGNQYESFTGGWFANPNTSAYVVFNADNIQFVNGDSTQTAAAIYTQNKIDVTRFSKLRIKGTVTNFDGNNIKFGLTNSNTTGYSPSFVASAQVSKTGSMDAVLDISGVTDGSYYVAVWSKYANFKITQIILEV